MKYRFLTFKLAGGALLAAVLAGVFLLGSSQPGELLEAYKNDNILRLHILANSNSEEDQSVKLKVRDAVIEEFAGEMQDAGNARQAEKIISDNVGRVRLAAEKAGYEGDVSVQIGDYEFPDRVYAGTLLPAGTYRAVRIILGEGEGDNWWCVMYPPLCFMQEDVPLWKTPTVKFESYFKKLFDEYFFGKEEIVNEQQE